jgi:hypothetical protein
VGIRSRLPVFKTSHNAMTALVDGQRSRKERSLQWLTDAELQSARLQAKRASDEAGRRLQDIDREEKRRSSGD